MPCRGRSLTASRKPSTTVLPAAASVETSPGAASKSACVTPQAIIRFRMPVSHSHSGGDAEETRRVIEAFLKNCRQPALLEPGEELFPITADSFALDVHGSRLTLQAWDRTRNLTRHVTGAGEPSNARLELAVEKFARRRGQVFLLDLARRAGADLGRRSGRLVFRERFRLFLRRQFPEWKLPELSAEADLEHSLSPVFPRAFIRQGQHGWAAIACPPDADAGGVLSFGLIWLDYLRHRERRTVLEGLALYLPAGREGITAHRLACLDSNVARFELFTYTEEDFVSRVDPADRGNLDTRLEPCRRPQPNQPDTWRGVAGLPGVESVARHDGRVSLRVRGMEFAQLEGGELRFGLADRFPAREQHLPEIERLVEELDRARSHAGDRGHPLYRQYPEAWLESLARTQIEVIDASLHADPIYSQVPAFAAGERAIPDLLAVDRSGRLAVIELKASADLNLPLQALDYWMRVKHHLGRGEFAAAGYFPGVQLRSESPRLFLVSPSLEFHPTTETVLGYFAPEIEVERVGLAVEWRKGLEVMFRLSGARRPR